MTRKEKGCTVNVKKHGQRSPQEPEWVIYGHGDLRSSKGSIHWFLQGCVRVYRRLPYNGDHLLVTVTEVIRYKGSPRELIENVRRRCDNYFGSGWWTNSEICYVSI